MTSDPNRPETARHRRSRDFQTETEATSGAPGPEGSEAQCLVGPPPQRMPEELNRIQHDLALALAATTSLKAGMRLCLDAALEAAGLEAGGIYLWDQVAGVLALAEHRGLSGEFVAGVARIDPASARGRVVVANRSGFNRLVSGEQPMPEPERREGLRFLGTVSIWDRDRLVGCINVASRTRGDIPAAAQLALETIAADADQAIVRLQAQEALQETENNFRAFFQSIDDLLLVAMTDGRILFGNAAVERKLGYSAEELPRLTVAELHPPELRAEAGEVIAAMFRGERETCPLPLARKDGSLLPVETRVWFGQWNGQRCLFGVCKDLSAEQEAKQRFERLFRRNPMPMALSLLPDGGFVDVNDAWLEFLGYERAEVIGKTTRELDLLPDTQGRDQALAQLKASGFIRNVELQVRNKDGSLRDGLFSGELMQNQGRGYFLTVMIDITERRRAEAMLRERVELQERLARVALTVPGMICSFRLRPDGSTSMPFATPAIRDLYGLEPEDVRDDFSPILRLVHPEDQDGLRAGIVESARTLSPWRGLFRARHPQRGEIWVEGHSMPQVEPDGSILWHGFVQDVTERKRLEQERETALAKYRVLFDSFPLAVTVADREGRIVESNRVAEQILGITARQQRERTIDGADWKLIRPDGSPMPPEEFASVRALRERSLVSDVQMGIVKSPRDTAWLNVTAAPLDVANYGVVVCYSDISARKQSEEALRVERQRLAAIIQGANVGTWEWNVQTGEIIFNERWAEMVGYALTDLAPSTIETWRRLAHPADLKASGVLLERHFSGELPIYECEARLRHRDGRWIWVLDRGRVTSRTEDGKPLLMQGTHVDITQRKMAEETLQAEATRRRILVEESSDGIVVLNEDGGVHEANRRFAELLGYSPEEIRRLRVWDWDRGWSPAQVLAAIRALGPEGARFETRHWRKDGSVFDVELSNSAAVLAGRKLIFCVCRDITERKRTEAKLRESLLFRREAEKIGRIGAWKVNPETDYVYWTEGVYEIVEAPLDYRPGLEEALKFYNEASIPRLQAALQAAQRDGTPFVVEARLKTTTGKIRWVEVRGLGRVEEGGEAFVMGTIQDITDRRQAQEALAGREEIFSNIVAQAADAIVVVDGDTGGFVEFNTAAHEGLGYTREEFARFGIGDIQGEHSPEDIRRTLAAISQKGSANFETRHRHRDGSLRDVRVSVRLLHVAHHHYLASVWTDVTELKRLESIRESLLSLGRQLNGTTDAASAGRAMLGTADRLWQWDAATLDLIVGDQGQIRPILCVDTVGGVRSDVPAKVFEMTERARRLVAQGPELTLREAGAPFPPGAVPFGDEQRPSVSVMAVPIHRDTQIIGVFSLHSYQPQAYTRDDLRVLQALADYCGGALERIRSEVAVRASEERYRQAQKLEAVGQLAGGVAHDFNNILAAMMMNLGMMAEHPGLDEPTRLSVSELQREARRASALTRQLLMFSRRSVLTMKALDLNDVVEDLLKMLRRLIGEHIALRYDGLTGLPLVEADAGMIEQVLVNLVVNARDAMPQGGRLTITTAVEEVTEADRAARPEARPGRFVCISTSDTGVGMTPETLQRIFEPFFTTKEAGKGTGLGLATVHGIVAQHKGWVEVESAVGRGSTFKVFLPVAPRAAAPAPLEPGERPLRRGQETILLVEDDAVLRRVVTLALRSLGYRVHAAANGKEAMQLWQDCGAEVHLLLTDMVMPEGMTGLELVERLRELRPGLKAIIMSGYSAEFSRPGVLKNAGVGYLPKPYETTVLAEMLRRALDTPS